MCRVFHGTLHIVIHSLFFLLMETKQCLKCGLVLPVSAFNPRKPRPSGTYKDGYDYRCKYCRSEYDKENRKWKQKYRTIDDRTLIKVRETEKHYFSENEILYIKLKVGYRKCKGEFISSNGKQMRVDKLKHKYFETA